MNVEKKRKFIIDTIYLVLITAILYGSIRYGIVWFMPFVIGFLVAFLLRPVIRAAHNKLKLGKKFSAVAVVMLFYATIGVLLTLLCFNLFIWLKALFLNLPTLYATSIEPAIYDIFGAVEIFFSRLDPIFIETIREISVAISSSMGNVISKLSTWMISAISGTLSSVPSFLLSVVFAIMSSFFFAMDYDKITNFLLRQFPNKGKEIIFDIKNYVIGTVFNFIKAYAILMSVTFCELVIGFSVLGIKNAVSTALFIAFLDVLPVLGTGSVLVPWVFVELIRGNTTMAIGLIMIYVFITIVRNVLEPKVVGSQVGLHPLLMLISMYLGVRLFGFPGLFVLPIIIIIMKNLNENGKIHLFK